MSDSEWCLIESDPGVFTELIRGLGCTGVEVEEIYSLDESLSLLKPVHGLIFLFKCDDKAAKEVDSKVVDPASAKLFFAKQVINNACASLAILNLLLNVEHEDVKLGETLQNLRSFSESFSSNDKGMAIGNSDVIRQVHNSFARNHIFEFDKKFSAEKEEAYHFIAYVPHGGHLYELDGLKNGPVDHGEIQDDWLVKASTVIQDRMKTYASSELRFTLLAVMSERLGRFERELAIATQNLSADGTKLAQDAELEVARLSDLIKAEEERHQRYRFENIRRRHNYFPLVVELLKILGERKLLIDFHQKAAERQKNRIKSEAKQ